MAKKKSKKASDEKQVIVEEVAVAAEAADAAETADKAETAEKAAPAEQDDAAEKAEAADKTEAADTAETADKAEVAEKAAPAEQDDAAEKAEAADKTEAADTAETADKAETAEKAAPAEQDDAAEKAAAADRAEAADTAETADKAETAEKAAPAEQDGAAEKAAAPEKTKKGFGINFRKYINSLQYNGLTLLFSALGTLVIMAAAFVAIFFLVLQSSEQVMVPNVVGEPLEEALLSMQVKELYPKIQLRYSNSAEDKGSILEQDPPAGTIVKAGRRINLTVSRGIVVDRVGSYVGQKVDDLRIALQAAFSGTGVQLINVPETLMYREDESEPGTILEQDPLPDTSITTPVTLSLVVSSGPGNEAVKVPWLVGMSLNDALLQMSRTKIIFNWTARPVDVEKEEEPGTVVSQRVPGSEGKATAYSVSECVIALPEGVENDLVYGIFETEFAAFPYALKVQLDVIPPEGDKYSLVTFRHLGGKLTIPYAVPQFSELVLYIEDKEQARQIVR